MPLPGRKRKAKPTTPWPVKKSEIQGIISPGWRELCREENRRNDGTVEMKRTPGYDVWMRDACAQSIKVLDDSGHAKWDSDPKRRGNSVVWWRDRLDPISSSMRIRRKTQTQCHRQRLGVEDARQSNRRNDITGRRMLSMTTVATVARVGNYRTTPRALPLFFGAPDEVILVVCINSPM